MRAAKRLPTPDMPRATLVALCLFAVIAAPAEGAAFEIAVSPDAIHVTAPTLSDGHRQQLERTARRDPFDRPMHMDLTQVGHLPEGGRLVTDLALRIALLLESGTVVISPESIEIDGASRQSGQVASLVRRLDAVRPREAVLGTRIVALDGGAPPAAELCADRLAVLSGLHPILFASDSTDLPPGAQPALDRLVALLSDCPSLGLTIVGRADGRGDPVTNESLALGRAERVAEALRERNIDAARLQTAATAATTGGADERRVDFLALTLLR